MEILIVNLYLILLWPELHIDMVIWLGFSTDDTYYKILPYLCLFVCLAYLYLINHLHLLRHWDFHFLQLEVFSMIFSAQLRSIFSTDNEISYLPCDWYNVHLSTSPYHCQSYLEPPHDRQPSGLSVMLPLLRNRTLQLRNSTPSGLKIKKKILISNIFLITLK